MGRTLPSRRRYASSVVAMTRPALQAPPDGDLTFGIVCVDESARGRAVWEVRAHGRFASPAGIMQGGFLAACGVSATPTAVVTETAGRPELHPSRLGPPARAARPATPPRRLGAFAGREGSGGRSARLSGPGGSPPRPTWGEDIGRESKGA